MLKKFGMVSAGVTAALLAAAPLASAGESCDDGGHGHGHDKGHHRGHDGHDSWGHGGQDVRGDSNSTCAIGGTKGGDGGSAKGGQEIRNSGILGAVTGPISNGGLAGATAGNITTLSCNSFLNHSLDDNFSGNHLNVLSESKTVSPRT